MTRHIKTTLMKFSPKNPHTIPTPFSPDIIKRIVDLVGDQTMQCELDIVTAAHMIAEMPDYVSPTVERRLLLNAVAKLAVAQTAIHALPTRAGLIAIDALPPSYGLRADALPVITEIGKRAAKMADKITAKRSNGSSPKRYTVAQQKRVAAEHTVYLLKGRKLTKAANDIAAMLFELGTGRVLTGRAFEKACAKALSAR
jgi:hypothetical protein